MCMLFVHKIATLLLLQMMRVELVKFNKRYGMAKMRGTCHVGANLVCEADLNLIMAKS